MTVAKLVKTAGLMAQRDADAAADPDLQANWGFVKDWSEEFRYKQVREARARKLYRAITDNPDGVLPWIRGRW